MKMKWAHLEREAGTHSHNTNDDDECMWTCVEMLLICQQSTLTTTRHINRRGIKTLEIKVVKPRGEREPSKMSSLSVGWRWSGFYEILKRIFSMYFVCSLTTQSLAGEDKKLQCAHNVRKSTFRSILPSFSMGSIVTSSQLEQLENNARNEALNTNWWCVWLKESHAHTHQIKGPY